MSDYSELKRLAEACIAAGGYLPGEAWDEPRSYGKDELAFLEFAPVGTPAAVLALIAENEMMVRKIERIQQLVTTQHESKEAFARRVQSVLEWKGEARS